MPDKKATTIASLLYGNIDQIDFTGPFEVFSRISNSQILLVGKSKAPIHDMRGFTLIPHHSLRDIAEADVIHVPGGPGQEEVMHDEEIISWLSALAPKAKFIFGVCTGVLILGAAGLLRDKQATTHWASHNLLKYFGAKETDQRVVVDGNLITTAGVTAGIDGALKLVSLLRDEEEAQAIQLYMEYDPQPPFQSGRPAHAPTSVLEKCTKDFAELSAARLKTAKHFAESLGVVLD